MLFASYPARYRDAFGEEETLIRNNGEELRMTLRGVEFEGGCLVWLPRDANLSQRSLFSIPGSALDNFTLEFDVPVSVVSQNQILQATLHIQQREEDGDTRATASLDLMNQTFHSQKELIDDFEVLLESLHKELSQGMYIKMCFFCAFSGYSPYGGGGSFCLDCFRNDKERYLHITSKGPKEPGFNFKLAYHHLKIETTQVIYCCPEFVRRSPKHYGI